LAAILLVGIIFIFAMSLQLRQERIDAESFKHKEALSKARNLFAHREFAGALEQLDSILQSKHVGPDARLLRAGVLVEGHHPEEASSILEDLLDEKPEIAGAAYALLARIIWEGPSLGPEELKKVDEYRQKAVELLPETAEAYYLRAMMAFTIPEKFRLLAEALRLDPRHYPSLRLRALTYQASRKYDHLRDDALAMTILNPLDPLGHSLRATALRELGDYEEAVKCYDSAIGRLPRRDDPQYAEWNSRRCETLIRMGEYERAIADAEACLKSMPDAKVLHFHIFCALTALGQYDRASAAFRRFTEPDTLARIRPRDWPMKYVFDTLETGGTWHSPDSKPEGPAFLPMIEAERMYRKLLAKARRLITDGFKQDWSPDGEKVVFSLGFVGYSGVAVYDLKSRETDLLIVPGKDPSWSPDGRHIAFVRDCEVLRLSELTATERDYYDRASREEEIWVMNADGTRPRRLAHGGWPSWSADPKRVYYRSRTDGFLYSVSIEQEQAQPTPLFVCPSFYPAVSPDGNYVACIQRGSLSIVDMASQSSTAEWSGPLTIWGGEWSPDGREYAFGGGVRVDVRTGLWIYDLDRKEGAKVLSGQITLAHWSPDKTQPRLLFHLGLPYWEIWVADLDPGVSTVEALGPARTVKEHFLERIEACSRELAVDPNLFDRHWERTASALAINHDQTSLYLEELGRAVEEAPDRAYAYYFYARQFLTDEQLLPLALALVSKATKKEAAYAKPLAPILYHMGEQEEAFRLWQRIEVTPNFLLNGGFERGLLTWRNPYGDLTKKEVGTKLVGAAVPEDPVEGKYCLYLEVAPGMANVWDAGLIPFGDFVFEAGKKYTVSAFLKARKGELDIKLTPQLDKDPWTGYGDEVITVTDTWAEYHVTTPVFKEDVSPATFAFHIGGAPGGFWIDDVRFYEGDYVPTVIEK
jgi:tetratricopeptide (TPR) repeat protein